MALSKREELGDYAANSCVIFSAHLCAPSPSTTLAAAVDMRLRTGFSLWHPVGAFRGSTILVEKAP
jgi:hypothetical protein